MIEFVHTPIEIELIRQMAREGRDHNALSNPDNIKAPFYCSDDLFTVKKAADWMQKQGDGMRPKMLFGNFWFEGELCILFADTNVGKSILAVQIGESLASGKPVAQFEQQINPQTVVYFDFEQSAIQFQARYTGSSRSYAFSQKFYRAELNAASGDVRNYLDRIHFCIEETVKRTQATILIVDNLTYLSNEAERARDALIMMKFLKMLKSKYKISILALAHTPKRNGARPITNNDMHGSKMLINFCDSAFTIGRSTQDPELRYLKQVKQRNALELYGESNVQLYTIKRNDNFVYFDYAGKGKERDHLQKGLYLQESEKQQIFDLHKQGHSGRKIADMLCTSPMTVSRVLRQG